MIEPYRDTQADNSHHEEVLRAALRIASHVRRTPVVTSKRLNELAGADLFFKCENLQTTGAFKIRGATNAVLRLTVAERRLGVATHSSGNHGAALASAARQVGESAWIVVPETATTIKRANIERYGGQIVECGPTLADREAKLEEVLADTGATCIPPYDHDDVIAGQGTLGLELVNQAQALDSIWLPVGGGGMAAGVVAAVGATDVQVCGAEPNLADDAAESLARGERLGPRPPKTIADGLRTGLGRRNFERLMAYRLPITLVDDEAILAAMRLLWASLELVVEPSGAVAFAAVLRARPQGRVGIVLSGGNVELDLLSIDV